MLRKTAKKSRAIEDIGISLHAPIKERVLYVPYMSDHAYVLAAGSRHCGVNAEVLPPQDWESLELGRKYTSSRECFPMICTTGSFLKKALEPSFDPKRSSFFMPDHNGPCRFGQYNRLQRIILDRIGLPDVKIISPGNDNVYTDLSGGQGIKFWVPTWKGTVAIDLLRKLVQERRPYEAKRGECDECYKRYLKEILSNIEEGARDLEDILLSAAKAFGEIEMMECERKPVISVTGEIFMRDNPFCSGYVVQKLEGLGAETMIAPVCEWFYYSTYRFFRDSVWKGDIKGIVMSRILGLFQHFLDHRTARKVANYVDLYRDIHINEVLRLCNDYVDKSYDGEPVLVMGTSAGQVKTGISGIVNILPFTCMPGTLIASISSTFRKDYDNIPWVNVVYDGQEDTGMDTRLQAFMHQARDYAWRKGLSKTSERRKL